jgi:hypothetical protein
MKTLSRRYPMCKEVMGILMAEQERNVRPIRGFCLRCGYGFQWAIIQTSAKLKFSKMLISEELNPRSLSNREIPVLLQAHPLSMGGNFGGSRFL